MPNYCFNRAAKCGFLLEITFHFQGYLGGGEDYYTRYKCEPKDTSKHCGIDFIDSKNGPTNETWGIYSTSLFLEKARQIIINHPKNEVNILQ